MNLKIKSLLAVMLVLLVLSCKKKPKNEPQPDNEPVPVAHGNVQGTAFQKTIGAEGGTIEMPNSNISVNIPAGAVTTSTNFTIQPVSKTLEGGIGQAYRLGPENVEFKQDIEISFKYTDGDIVGAAEDFLYLAYQDSEGYWNRATKTTLDKQNKTVKIKTRHFSDWVIERIFWIRSTPDDSQSRELSEDETITFEVGYEDSKVNQADPNAASEKIGPPKLIDPKNIEKWELTTGNPSKVPQGTISPEKLPTNTYKAPSKIANGLDQEIIGCHIINLIDKKYLERPGTSGKVLIARRITLTSNEFFTWTVDGQENSAVQMFVQVGGNSITIDGIANNNSGYSIQVNAGKAGTYSQGGQPDQFMPTLNYNSKIYASYYSTCNGSDSKYGNGNLVLGNVGSKGNFVSGEFTSTVYSIEGCGPVGKTVTGKFKIRRLL